MYEKPDTETSPVHLEDLLTSKDLARILNISRPFAYKLMHLGEIPVVRLGKAIRVRPVDLDRYIKTHLSWGK